MSMESGTAEQDDLVAATIRDSFEMQEGHLTNEQVSQRVVDMIDALEGDDTKVIALIGGPASGKSTLVQLFIDDLTAQGKTVDSLSTDDYSIGTREWRWEREREDPLKLKDFGLLNRNIEAIKELHGNETVAVPRYDQLPGLAVEAGEENFPHRVGKVDVLFVEGDFDGAENPDLMVFLDAPMHARMQARIDRDLKLRGEADPEKVANSFLSRHEKQFIPHTAPAIKKADIVLQVDPTSETWHYDIFTRPTTAH